MNVYIKQKETHRENKLVVTTGKRECGGTNQGCGIKRNKHQSHEKTRRNFKHILLIERIQSEKVAIFMNPTI